VAPAKKASKEQQIEPGEKGPDDLLARVGGRVRELRRLQGMTLAVLGEFIGVDEAFLSKVEAGKLNLTLRTIERIARGLGVHVHELFVPRDQSGVRPKRVRGGA
jgi:transcriptional regulator with XRE-family HTH domain